MDRRAQLTLQTFGDDSQILHLAVSDPNKEVDFELIFDIHERTTLFMPEAVLVDSCTFWLDGGIDRVIRVSTRTVTGITAIRGLLGQDAIFLGHVLDGGASRESSDFVDCVSTADGLHVTGREFLTASTLGNIAEKLRVADNLGSAEITPVPPM